MKLDEAMPTAGWFANITWDPANGIFYATQMGKPMYKLQVEKN